MSRKMKYALAIAIFLLLLDTFLAVKLSEHNFQSKQTDLNWSSVESLANENRTAKVITKQYKKDGIVADYPVFISGGNEELLEQWNNIIVKDFNKILEIYSFNPIPEPARAPADRTPTILTIKSEMKLNNANYISILYTAAFNSPSSAHPSELVYTTNIDKMKNERMKLSDIVILNNDFVRNFRTWNYIPSVEGNEEWNKAVEEYVNNMSDEDLLLGFQNADIIGSDNLYSIYSYLTNENMGISLGVPNFIGDHAEFENKYEGIKDYLKPDFKF